VHDGSGDVCWGVLECPFSPPSSSSFSPIALLDEALLLLQRVDDDRTNEIVDLRLLPDVSTLQMPFVLLLVAMG